LIIFKKSAIHVRGNYLLLSVKDKNNPLKYRWNSALGTPQYVSISWIPETGWQLNLVLNRAEDVFEYAEGKLLAIDLGVKRLAASYEDSGDSVLYSGKVVRSLVRLRNKVNSETQARLSSLVKHSRKYKKLRRANRRVVSRINDRLKDILHKTSRTIVNYCQEKGIGVIAFGDCSGTHDSPNLGKETNQKVSQGLEQKLMRYVRDKFEGTGGKVIETPEHYTSRTCPSCGAVKNSAPQGRVYSCRKCRFLGDRDVVGAVNIHRKVSFGESWFCQGLLDVVGGLTPPCGWKYSSTRSCLVQEG
jgi:putative transposase